MKHERQWETESSIQLNPKSRQPPRVYQRHQQSNLGGVVKTHDVVLMFIAIFTTVGFVTLCAVIA